MLTEAREVLALMRESDINAVHAWMTSPRPALAELVFGGASLALARRIEANRRHG